MELLAIRLSPQAGKSLVIPQAGEEANERRVKQAIRKADARKINLQFRK
jgi:hypothetical protein